MKKLFCIVLIGLLSSCAPKKAEQVPVADSTVVAVDTIRVDSSSYTHVQSNDNDNSWLIGDWEVQTDVGLATLIILDSKNAISQGDRGTYTVENGVLGVHSNGVCTAYNVNYQDQTIELGGGVYF